MNFLLFFWACSQASSDASWRAEALYEDNWRFLHSNPLGLQQKFTRMVNGRYDFLRGSQRLQLYHWTDRSRYREEHPILVDPYATQIPILGDPHPENLMVVVSTSGAEELVFSDLDSAAIGPWTIDYRRAAVSLLFFVEGLIDKECEVHCSDKAEILFSYCNAYIEQVNTDSEIMDPFSVVPFRDLLEEALEEGEERQRFHNFTTVREGRRELIRKELTADGKGLINLTVLERRQFDRLLKEFSHQLGEETRLIDVVHRKGMGVSSLPVKRYMALIDSGISQENERIIFVREVLDPPFYPGMLHDFSHFESNADRVGNSVDYLWPFRMDDDYFGLSDDGQDFKSLGYNSYRQGLDQEKGLSSLSGQEDVAGALSHFAAAFGATLALTHRRASTRFWGQSDIVSEELSQISSEEFCTQTARIALDDEQLLELDRAWFADRFNQQGPLLGLERMQ